MSDYKGDDSARSAGESSVQSNSRGELYRPQVGDRVRVVLEGEVGWVGSKYFEFVQGVDYIAFEDNAVSIEKVEPPVEFFRPGDVVREKDPERGSAAISLGREGFINHSDGAFFRYGRHGFYLRLDQFTSERFERVTLS